MIKEKKIIPRTDSEVKKMLEKYKKNKPVSTATGFYTIEPIEGQCGPSCECAVVLGGDGGNCN